MSFTTAFIGGTGMEKLFDGQHQQHEINTPYGPVHYSIVLNKGIEFVVVDRHYASGSFRLPHQIDHRAYMYALTVVLGVKFIISTSAVGGINGNAFQSIKTGSLVLPADFIDLTREVWTFATEDFVHPEAFHRSTKDMICPRIQELLRQGTLGSLPGGILACAVKGPRYETRPEVIDAQELHHADLLGMCTVVPEIILAREASVHYGLICNVTDMPLKERPVEGAAVQTAAKENHGFIINMVWPAIMSLQSHADQEFSSCECQKQPAVFEIVKRVED